MPIEYPLSSLINDIRERGFEEVMREFIEPKNNEENSKYGKDCSVKVNDGEVSEIKNGEVVGEKGKDKCNLKKFFENSKNVCSRKGKEEQNS